MALIKKLEKSELERPSVHKSASCTFTIFQEDNESYLQIDTYGSETRKMKGKKSQTLQFGPEGISQLKDILKKL